MQFLTQIGHREESNSTQTAQFRIPCANAADSSDSSSLIINSQLSD